MAVQAILTVISGIWNSIPNGIKNLIYISSIIGIAYLYIMYQNNTIDNLRDSIEHGKNDIASKDIEIDAQKAITVKLEREYKLSMKAVKEYNTAIALLSDTISNSNDGVKYVYVHDAAAKATLDTYLGDDIINSMCINMPCDSKGPSSSVTGLANGVNGNNSVPTSIYNPGTVGALIENRANLVKWGLECKEKHTGLIEHLHRIGGF